MALRHLFEIGKNHLGQIGALFGEKVDFAHAGPIGHWLLIEADNEALWCNDHLLPFVGGGLRWFAIELV